MLTSDNQTLTLSDAKKAIIGELGGMVAGKIQETILAINAHNNAQEEKALEAEKLLAKAEEEVQAEESAFAKMMWPVFLQAELDKIAKIREAKKPLPEVQELEAFLLNDVAGRILAALQLKEATVTVRKPRGGDSSFNGVWGSAFTHERQTHLFINYRILPDSVKESNQLGGPDFWVVASQNSQGKWYVSGKFEATSPSNVILNAKRIITKNPALTQTNLAGSAWYAGNSEAMTKLLALDSEKVAKGLSA